MRSLRTVVFDKTGTLTTGEFHVSGITGASGISDINNDDGNRIPGLRPQSTPSRRIPLAKQSARKQRAESTVCRMLRMSPPSRME